MRLYSKSNLWNKNRRDSLFHMSEGTALISAPLWATADLQSAPTDPQVCGVLTSAARVRALGKFWTHSVEWTVLNSWTNNKDLNTWTTLKILLNNSLTLGPDPNVLHLYSQPWIKIEKLLQKMRYDGTLLTFSTHALKTVGSTADGTVGALWRHPEYGCKWRRLNIKAKDQLRITVEAEAQRWG